MERNRLLAIIGLIFLVAFTAGWLLKGQGQPQDQPGLIIDAAADAKPADTPPPVENPPLWVYVVGAVEKPGVYQLSTGSRVFQAIELAGASPEADVTQLDMARVLTDGEKIRVPRQGEKLVPEAGLTGNAEIKSGNPTGLVNINTASAQDLDSRLPGIGPALAQRIVDYRSQRPFTKKEDIKEVSGIGDKRYDAIKDLITVTP